MAFEKMTVNEWIKKLLNEAPSGSQQWADLKENFLLSYFGYDQEAEGGVEPQDFLVSRNLGTPQERDEFIRTKLIPEYKELLKAPDYAYIGHLTDERSMTAMAIASQLVNLEGKADYGAILESDKYGSPFKLASARLEPQPVGKPDKVKPPSVRQKKNEAWKAYLQHFIDISGLSQTVFDADEFTEFGYEQELTGRVVPGPSPAFEKILRDGFKKAWDSASSVGENVSGYDPETGHEIYDTELFMDFVVDKFVPESLDDDKIFFTPDEWKASLAAESKQNLKKILDKFNTDKLDAEEKARAALELSNKIAQNDLQKLIRKMATDALREAGMITATSSGEDLAFASKFASNLLTEYNAAIELGVPFDVEARIRTRASAAALDKAIEAQQIRSGQIGTLPTSEILTLTAQMRIAAFQERVDAGTATDEERAALTDNLEMLASLSESGMVTAPAGVIDRQYTLPAMTTEEEEEFQMSVNEIMQTNRISLVEAQQLALAGLGMSPMTMTEGDPTILAQPDARMATDVPSVGTEAVTSFANVGMAQRFGAGKGGGNVNYSPSGQLQEVAGGGYVDMGKVSEIVSTYGLGGDPMLQEPGFLQFMIERDKALREGYASEREGLESAYTRSLGRYGEVDPDDIKAGRIAEQDARGATMQQELKGQLGRFPTFGDYLKTVTRDQFTSGFEQKNVTEQKRKRVGVML